MSWQTFENRRPDAEDMDQDPVRTAWDLRIARAIVRCLQDHYPGHPWMVEVLSAQGVAHIWVHTEFMAFGRLRFTIHLATLFSDPMMRCVMRAGGEICERYNLKREAFDQAAYLDGAQEMKKLSAQQRRNGVFEL